MAQKKSKKSASKKSSKGKGKKQYTCESCGLVVSVDNCCECGDECDIVCCGEEMKPVKG